MKILRSTREAVTEGWWE